jgi:hypothetical protein
MALFYVLHRAHVGIKIFASQEIMALFYVLHRAHVCIKGVIHSNSRNYSTVSRLLGSRFRNPLREWIFVC